MAAALTADQDFESDAFNATAWANALLSTAALPPHLSRGAPPPAGSTPLSALLSAHHESLHLLSTDAHASLDDALARATSAVPWAVREAEKVRQRAAGLRAGVDGVGERVAGVEGAVSAAVAAIADADTLVRRVDGAAALLKQAAAADALLARLDSLLAGSSADGSDLVTAADVVAELRAALDPLRAIDDLASRFERLDTADEKLETLAEPRLRAALEMRNGPAAGNARIVFDRAGRDNAFMIKYVDIRAALVADMWRDAWRVADEDDADERPAQYRGVRRPAALDLSSTQAALKLDDFYTRLLTFLRAEADWLAVAFPDLRDHLLPLLLTAALADPAAPSLTRLRPDPAQITPAGVTRLHHAALRSARAAADVARVLKASLPVASPGADAGASPRADGGDADGEGEATEQGAEKERMEDLSVRIFDAISSALFPSRTFWTLWPSLVAKAGENAAHSIPMNEPAAAKPGVVSALSLVEIAKIVESSGAPLVAMLDALSSQISDWTVGVGVFAMPAATTSASMVFSRRVLALVRKDQTLPGRAVVDDWGRVGGALRLLRAVSALKQTWEARKEACLSIAAGPSMTLLEEASALDGQPQACVMRLLEWADTGNWAEASATLQLAQESSLGQRVVNTVQSMEEKSDDFRGLLDGVQRVVYTSMFEGIRCRFHSFDREAVWGADKDTEDESMPGFTSSPLSYATGIADYLMTIPQQLEPYVPSEEDDPGYGTPLSIYAFSPMSDSDKTLVRKSSTPDLVPVEDDGDEPPAFDAAEDPGATLSFAGMWIGALAIGTMELYMDKVLAIGRLTPTGARQLATDAEYLCNVLAALGVTPTPEVEAMRLALAFGPDRAAYTSALGKDELSPGERRVLTALARMRGVPVAN